jgi:hypothetical protein
MKRWLVLLLATVLLAGLGCGDRDKGINSEKDRPKPADKGG